MKRPARPARTATPEICGLTGDSDVGYCVCTRPAGHYPTTEHGCAHGTWH